MAGKGAISAFGFQVQCSCCFNCFSYLLFLSLVLLLLKSLSLVIIFPTCEITSQHTGVPRVL